MLKATEFHNIVTNDQSLQTAAHLASNPNRSPLQPGDRASVTMSDREGCFEASSGALEKSTEKHALCASITSTLACNSQKFSYLAFYLTLHMKSILLHVTPKLYMLVI